MADTLGAVAIPLLLVTLGANLARGPGVARGRLPAATCAAVVVTRLVLLPAVCGGLLLAAWRAGGGSCGEGEHVKPRAMQDTFRGGTTVLSISIEQEQARSSAEIPAGLHRAGKERAKAPILFLDSQPVRSQRLLHFPNLISCQGDSPSAPSRNTPL